MVNEPQVMCHQNWLNCRVYEGKTRIRELIESLIHNIRACLRARSVS